MVYYRAIRIDASFDEEDKIEELLSKKGNMFWVYCKEISKKNKKEHFHIVLMTERDPSTITKDIVKIFTPNSDRTYSNKKVKDIVKALAYCMKDGNYDVWWPDPDQIEQAQARMEEFQEEEHLTSLRDKIIFHLNKIPQDVLNTNTNLMYSILKIFKHKELAYPSQAWLKQCMVSYYMQNSENERNLKNIETLYNIRDSDLD